LKNRSLKIISLLIVLILGIFLTNGNPKLENFLEAIGLESVVELFQDKYELPEENEFIIIDKDPPHFTEEDKKFRADYQYFSPLDNLNRVGPANALIGPDSLPRKQRGDISKVYPSGWHQKMYDFVDGRAVYNRCHLIAHSLTGEDDNWLNLMTGTRSFNNLGMHPFEKMVSEYIKDSGKKVRYRVTPVFKDDELIARGVIMEAFSIEDNGKKINFRVFIKNFEPGVEINYKTGRNRLAR